jgi:protein-S-isoprenylcysteine O-methyltransferase Ste14
VRTRVASVLGSLAFLVAAPGVVAGWVPYRLSGWVRQDPPLGLEALRYAGVALALVGAAALLHAFARFALEGRGTPAPIAPTETLVVSGLYRWVRNPMYVAVLALVFGQALLFASRAVALYGLALWLLFHLFVVTYEEPTLARRYGESYERFRASVNRWLPRPPRASPPTRT